MMMRSAVAVVAFVLCVSSVRAFFAPLGRPCAGVSHRSVGLSRSSTSAPHLSMSSVALPPPSPTTHEHQRPNIQRVKANDDFLSALAEHQDKLVVVKFYDRFCRACDEIRPRFENLSGSAGVDQAAFYEIEFSDSKDLCKQLGIKRLPTVHMYAGANGRVVDLPAGPSRFNQVEEKFSDVLASMAREEAKDEFRGKGGIE